MNRVKGLILCGGEGTRLRPITHTSAKQLVPVANKPILFYALEQFAEAGITDIGMIVGDTAEEIKEAVGDGSRWGLHVTYIRQEQPLGLAHCVLIARDFLGDDDFVMYLGDNLLQEGLVDFVTSFEAGRQSANQPTLGGHHAPPAAQILLAKVPDPQRFGVAELDEDGNAVRLVEKPDTPPSDLALVGVYLFTPKIHAIVAELEPSERGELEITDAIQRLIDAGEPVRTEQIQGWWLDTGKLTPLLEANRLVLETVERSIKGTVHDSDIEGRVVVEEGAEVTGSRIRGPAVIGRDARVINSFIGPFTAVGNGCEIRGSELDHSVVLERCRLTNVPRLIDSLVGRDSEITRSDVRPRATRLLVGDHSQVDLG